ncbi:MAG: acyl-CoA dehydrogenase family protein [Deltaproteobacteria bacterium]|nr:acyl-CoA dehydrogenase family protein [Deltaproteobacteria bacterium]MBW2664704.1 acyl-CoA dehydrogenase family protein [Deltaproteobacteria bacterium]
MHIDFTPEHRALRKELRNYYRELFTPELRAAFEAEHEEMGGPVFREIVGRMGKDGWLGIGWPTEYGGKGFTAVEQFIFWDETYRARAPLPIISVNTIGPTIMQFGTDAQKAELLPKITSGEMFFGVGYTEPSAGTDLAALQTRAERDGDEYVINGQKIFTTHAQDCEYIWLAARTDPDAPKHKGISIILVPTDSPGFSLTPIYTLGRERTNATFFEDVRVPISNLVGEENSGWMLITSQLNHERITLAAPGVADRLLDEVWQWAADTPSPDGGRMLDEGWVQIQLAKVYAKLEALKVLNWRSAWTITNGVPNMAEASALKVFGTEFLQEAYNLLLEIIGDAGLIKEGEPGAMLGGLLESSYRTAGTYTFGGGVNEVQRDIIAAAGLGLPRRKR